MRSRGVTTALVVVSTVLGALRLHHQYPHTPWWALVVGCGLIIGLTLVVAAVRGKAVRDGWNWDTMSAARAVWRLTVDPLPTVAWRPGVFVDAVMTRKQLDKVCFAGDVTVSEPVAAVTETLQQLFAHATHCEEVAPGCFQVLYEGAPAGSGVLATAGARVFVRVEAAGEAARVRFVSGSGGFNLFNPAVGGAETGVEALTDLLGSFGGVLEGVADFIIEVEAEHRGAAVVWVALAATFGHGAEAARQIAGLRLSKEVAVGFVRSVKWRVPFGIAAAIVVALIAGGVIVSAVENHRADTTSPAQIGQRLAAQYRAELKAAEGAGATSLAQRGEIATALAARASTARIRVTYRAIPWGENENPVEVLEIDVDGVKGCVYLGVRATEDTLAFAGACAVPTSS